MTNYLVEGIFYWLNYFPIKRGVCRTIGTDTILQGETKPYMSKDIIIFGAYDMVYTRKIMKARSISGIALCKSNDHGGHHFMSLYTGK